VQQLKITAMEKIVKAKEDSKEEQASLNRMIARDEDSEEEHSLNKLGKDKQAAIIISQLPINDHSFHEEHVTFFHQQEIALMERILKAEDFYIAVPKTPSVSSWIESFSN
jgi:hypothetical protein